MIEVSVLIDWIVKLSGWVLAVGLGVWRIVDAFRYRHDIKIDVGIIKHEGTEYLDVTVKNNGRRPFHVIDVGLLYSNDESYGFLPPYFEKLPASITGDDQKFSVKMPSFWLYKRRPYRYSLNCAHIKEDLKKQNTTISKIYVTQETGDDKVLVIPDNIKKKFMD